MPGLAGCWILTGHSHNGYVVGRGSEKSPNSEVYRELSFLASVFSAIPGLVHPVELAFRPALTSPFRNLGLRPLSMEAEGAAGLKPGSCREVHRGAAEAPLYPFR